MLGYEDHEIENHFDTWRALLHPEDRDAALRKLEAYITGRYPHVDATHGYRTRIPQFEVEHRLRHKDGSYRWILTRGTLLRDAQGVPYRMVGSHVDITSHKESEQELQDLITFQNILTTTSTKFINLAPEEIDEGIERALQAIGMFTGVDRSYVFLYSDDKWTMRCTHEWCAEGIEAGGLHLQNMPVEHLRWSNAKLLRGEVLHIPQVSALPPEAAAERQEFEAQGIQSLIVVPMAYRGDVTGFLGFDAVRHPKHWSVQSQALLKSVGEIFVNALEHKRAQAIRAGQQQFMELLATGGGFTETLEALIRIIEEQSPGMLGLILLLDEDGRHLHIGASPSLP